jgi:dephospho-CoA kinase
VKTVGLTGGIGSGKTVISKIFSLLGVPVYNADFESKKLLMSDAKIHAALFENFGESVFSNQLPDKQKIASIVFSQPAKLEVLNAIMHPRVREHFTHWSLNHSEKPYVIQEAAILFETGQWHSFNYTVVVTAPENIRIKRVMARDNLAYEMVKQRIDNQWTDHQKLELSSFSIQNDDNQRLLPQVLSIHQQILQLISHG